MYIYIYIYLCTCLYMLKDCLETCRSFLIFYFFSAAKFRNIFLPISAIFWEVMIDVLKEFTTSWTSGTRDQIVTPSSSGKKSKKRKSVEISSTNIDSTSHTSRDQTEKTLAVVECIKNTCIFSNVEFMEEGRYNLLMPELMAMLPLWQAHGDEEIYLRFIEDTYAPAVSAMAASIGKDLQWKPLNLKLLMNFRDKKSCVRMAALKILHKLFVDIGEEYLILLPECLPYLSELLEDDNEEINIYSAEVIRYIENISGETLEDYLQ